MGGSQYTTVPDRDVEAPAPPNQVFGSPPSVPPYPHDQYPAIQHMDGAAPSGWIAGGPAAQPLPAAQYVRQPQPQPYTQPQPYATWQAGGGAAGPPSGGPPVLPGNYGYEAACAPQLTSSYSDYLPYGDGELVLRHGFLRKVLGLVCTQLVATVVVAGAFVLSADIQHFFYQNPWLLWASMGLTLVPLLVLGCSEEARQAHPTNLVLMALFTLGEAVMVGCISMQYRTQTVLLALAITAAITVCLTAYALQTKYDFTTSGGILFAALMALTITGIVGIFWHSHVLELLIAGGGALVMSCYIVYDVQLISAGEHAVQVGPDDYVLAAINIYTDIVTLFVYLLRLLQAVQGEEN